IGDSAFDSRMLIKGASPHHVAALMNERVRALLQGIAGRTYGLNLTSNWFEIVLDYERKSKDDIVSIARDALEVARDMARGDDARFRLLENVRRDSVPGVRAACIRHLASHFPVNGDMTALLKRALKDDSRFVRIEAALNLGYEGLEFLAQLLNKESDRDEYDTLRIIRHFGEHRFAGGIPVLKKVFARANNETVLLEILKAFISMGDTGLNGFLLERLGGSSGDIRYWLVSALGSCGTAEAVEPLMKLAKSSLNPLFRSDVQRAIAGIQSRLGGADAGWLSIHESPGAEGGLSMPAGKEGALSNNEVDRASEKNTRKDR
ncbi:MAG: HEAT repeat domain-containing protein, partial [Spirochaetes bacterium]|nr:HEAT repeat domain-containing protein [Spirochaetota bacterium]